MRCAQANFTLVLRAIHPIRPGEQHPDYDPQVDGVQALLLRRLPILRGPRLHARERDAPGVNPDGARGRLRGSAERFGHFSERFVLPIEDRAVLRGYDEYADLPEDSQIRVYALDEICVEKVVALTDRARNEPRDLYDVWYLTSKDHVDLATLVSEIDRKLEFRGRSRDTMGEEFKKKEARYKKLWRTRLGSQMAELPPFDDVFRSVRRSLRAAELIPRT